MGKTNSKRLIESEVKNFGPIVEVKVDLRPFTLFVGPSNTGKSYLAVLIYALHRLFGAGYSRRLRHITGGFGVDFPVIFGTRHGYRQLRRGGKSTKLPEESIEILFNWIKQTFPKGGKSFKQISKSFTGENCRSNSPFVPSDRRFRQACRREHCPLFWH